MKLTVKIYDANDTLVISKTLDEGVYRIGRSEFCDLVLPHDSISRSQIELRVSDATAYFTNMGSAGRVKFNGKRVETAEIKDGDELGVGPFRLVLFHGERMEQVPPALEPNPLPEAENPEGGAEVFDLGNANAPSDEGNAPENENPFENEVPVPEPQFQRESSVAFASDGNTALKAETVVEVKPVVAKLIFTSGAKAGEEMFLEAYEVTLGRSKRADIFLDDGKLSRLHAKITRVGMGYRLIDLNSRNGTYVNGMRILEHPLSSFDEIQIGNCKIKFLIHDIVVSEMERMESEQNLAIRPASPLEQTKSMMPPQGRASVELLSMEDQGAQAPLILDRREGALPPPLSPPAKRTPFWAEKRNMVLGGLVVLLLMAYFLLPSSEPPKPQPETAQGTGQAKPEVRLPPSIPREFTELTPDGQREIEGFYNAAKKVAENGGYEEALVYLKKIHDTIPYYKDSLAIQNDYRKKWNEMRAAEAQERANKSEKADLQFYLDEGMEYLAQGDWEKAGDAFNSAIVLDPQNETARKGLKAVEYKVRRFEDIPPERDPELEKRDRVKELFAKAISAYKSKSYQEAIDSAEEIRKIELKGDTAYLNQAKQIIDQARILQKEEFEPFLIQAKEKYAEGDYNASRDMCEEMTKRDANYTEAQECLMKAKKQLNRLAKEAYTHGYILESMNRIEEAKQYWNRAKNYVRPGDEYYDKVIKKLEFYQ